MDVSYYYYYDSNLGRNLFSDCRSIDTYITGFSPGTEYSQYDSWYSIIDGKRTLACTAKGITKYYLLVDGALKLYETQDTFYEEFYL